LASPSWSWLSTLWAPFSSGHKNTCSSTVRALPCLLLLSAYSPACVPGPSSETKRQKSYRSGTGRLPTLRMAVSKHNTACRLQRSSVLQVAGS
jgi:hypothetical protein